MMLVMVSPEILLGSVRVVRVESPVTDQVLAGSRVRAELLMAPFRVSPSAVKFAMPPFSRQFPIGNVLPP